MIVVARHIPGGRTAVTLTAGAVRYPLQLAQVSSRHRADEINQPRALRCQVR